jgi:MtN3 and saliva related transmembrane protein
MNDTIIQVIGIVAGIFTALSLLPQLVKLLKTKKAEDISILYLITLFCGVALWILYGVLRQDLPIILTNIASLTLNVLIMVLGIKYKTNNGDRR